MKNRSLVILSGEGTTVPAAEARALFLSRDPASSFESPEPRVIIADSDADPFEVGTRVAFSRRVGVLFSSPSDALELLRRKRVRFRCFDLAPKGAPPDPGDYLKGAEATVDLTHPELELTLVRGEAEYLAVTAPSTMVQKWAERRPRARPFFHPSAIFPKLSRALVNLSRCRRGGVFLEPFCGTGSIAMEASMVGAEVVALDLSRKMVTGALANMKRFSESWAGVIRGDAALLPLRRADAVATDIPYGRASSTEGRPPERQLSLLIPALAGVMPSGSFLVLMHPQDVPVEPGSYFSTLEEHHLHVHKLLTRTISVLRRN